MRKINKRKLRELMDCNMTEYMRRWNPCSAYKYYLSERILVDGQTLMDILTNEDIKSGHRLWVMDRVAAITGIFPPDPFHSGGIDDDYIDPEGYYFVENDEDTFISLDDMIDGLLEAYDFMEENA